MNTVKLYMSLLDHIEELSQESNRIMMNSTTGKQTVITAITIDFEEQKVSIATKELNA